MNDRIEYKHLNSDLEIYDELKNIFNSEDIYDETAISLYDVLKTIQKKLIEYDSVKNIYEDYFERLLKRRFDRPIIKIEDNLRGNNELSMLFTPDYYKERPSKSITFSENDFGLYIKNDKTSYRKDIYSALPSSDIVNCYCDLLPYSDFLKERKEYIKPLNSNFYVNIDRFGVELSNKKSCFSDNFSFFAFSGYGGYRKGEFRCNKKLSRSYSMIIDNENELLKKIFVEIEDCPKWSKKTLYQAREKELNSIKNKILKLFK